MSSFGRAPREPVAVIPSSARPHLLPLFFFGLGVGRLLCVISSSKAVSINFACEQGPELSNSSRGCVVLASFRSLRELRTAGGNAFGVCTVLHLGRGGVGGARL